MLIRMLRALTRPPRRTYSKPKRQQPPRNVASPTSRKRSPELSKHVVHGKAHSFDPTTAKLLPRGHIISGRAYVVDGDTIKVQKHQIRLFGIDAPEMNHPYGPAAKTAMFDLCRNQTVHAEILEVDNHGRTVAKCHLDDGRDLSAELVKQGLAIDWPKYSGGVYSDLEVPDVRRKLWLADARQKGRMYLWYRYDLENGGKPTSTTPPQSVCSKETMPTKQSGPKCPKCGANMVKRPNRKTGADFLGCSKFPECRGSRSLD